MYKSILFVAFISLIAVMVAGHENHENAEVVTGMRRAFNEGMERFGGAVKNKFDTTVPMPSAQSSKVFSLYTKGLKAPGGGKPSILDQYRQHNYVPPAPVVVPKELPPVTGKMTAADAAIRHIPGAPLQYTTDHFGI